MLYSPLRSEFKDTASRFWGNIFSYFVSNPKFPVILLTILAGTLIFMNLGLNHLIPFDEAIYAKVSKNILIRNDWQTLSWQNNVPWFEKPPLYFWLSALVLKIVSSAELAVRLPSALAGFFTVLLTYFFGKRLFGKTAGFIAGFSLLTTFQFLYYSRTGMLDVTCTFFITAALFTYQLSRTHLKTIRPFFLFLLSGIFVGLAILTKGVVGVLPLAIIGLVELTTLRTKNLGHAVLGIVGRLGTTVLVSVVVFLPWHLSMYQLHGANFINSYLGYHVLGRATLEVEDKVAPSTGTLLS